MTFRRKGLLLKHRDQAAHEDTCLGCDSKETRDGKTTEDRQIGEDHEEHGQNSRSMGGGDRRGAVHSEN